MMSPALTLAWHYWRRNRWGFALSAAYLLAATTLIRCLPREWMATTMGENNQLIVANWLGLPGLFILMHVLVVFTTADAGLKVSDYSARLFVLPLSTRTLVAGPMLAGCATMIIAWLAIALLVWRPAGVSAPLFWPAAAACLMLAVMQVVSWLPLAQSWLRLVLLVPLLAVVLTAILMKLVFAEFSEALATAALLLPLPVLYLAAVQAVGMARRGDAIDWQAWRRLVERLAAWRKPAQQPFASAGWAQHWFEWRGHGWVLPASMGALTPIIGSVIASADRTNVEAGWRMLAIVAAMPPLFALVLGLQLGKQDVWSGYEMSPFLAARPISTTRLIGAKFWMCLTSTLAGFGLVLLWASVLLTRPGFPAHVGQVAEQIGVLKFSGIALAATAGLIVIAWLQMAANMWITLTGRYWLITAFSFAFASLIGIGVLGSVCVCFHEPLHGYVRAAGPWVMGALLAFKALLAIAVVGRLVQRRLASAGAAASMLVIWAAVAGGLWATIWWLAPSGILPLGELAAGIALAVPFSRLAGAPLALDWNRHR